MDIVALANVQRGRAFPPVWPGVMSTLGGDLPGDGVSLEESDAPETGSLQHGFSERRPRHVALPAAAGGTLHDGGEPEYPSPGTRVSEQLLLLETLEQSERTAVYLGESAELVIVCVARTQDSLDRFLALPEASEVHLRTTMGPWFIAAVAIHDGFERYMDKMLDVGRAALPEPGSTSGASTGDAASTHRAIPLGTSIVGRFTLEATLGRGGMGEVYRAYDNAIGRTIALKILRPDGTPNAAGTLQRVLKEARIVGAFVHPHIVQIFDVGEHEGAAYLALELCEGGSLRSRLSNATSDEKQRWVRQIAEALAYAHKKGILHRDVKPDNVVITADGHAKLTDFGVARAIDAPDGHSTTGIAGTPQFMAPEQLLGEPLDERTDQYAWALVAVSVWTGEDYPRRVAQGAGLEAALATGGAPSGLAKILKQALSSDRQDRFHSMNDVLATLDAMSKAPDSAAASFRRAWRTLGRTPGFGQMPRRQRRARFLRVGLVGLGGVVAVASAWRLGRHEVRPDTEHAFSAAPQPVAAPSTTNAQSDPLIEGGLQLWMDGASLLARAQFSKAAEKNPEDPRAHLLYWAASSSIDANAREHARIATSLRARLSGVDAELFDALQPLVSEPPNRAETTRRLEALRSRFPQDRPLLLALAAQYIRNHDTDRAFELARASASTGENIRYWLPARAYLSLGRSDDARPLLRECIHHVPGAADCLEWLGRIDTNEGRCADGETTARKLIALSPEQPIGYLILTRAVIGTTHSTRAARAVLAERIARTNEPKEQIEAIGETSFRVLDGDFDAAYESATTWDRSVSPSSDGFAHWVAILARMNIDLELGRQQAASEVALMFADRSRTWLPSEIFDATIETARALYMTSQLSRDQFVTIRNQALLTQEQIGGGYTSPAARWFDSYVQYLWSDEDVRDAIANVPTENSIDSVVHESHIDTELGHLYLRAGRIDDAIKHLRRATASCAILGLPHDHVRAYLWLGQALDATDQHEQACDAYEHVISHWGRDPRSRTARAASQQLAGCSKFTNKMSSEHKTDSQ